MVMVMVVLKVGANFGASLWLVTRVVTATRRKVDDQVLIITSCIGIIIASIITSSS